MAASKSNGQSFGATVTFQHRGAGGDFDVGIGIKYTPTPTWAYATVTLPNDPDWTPYSVDVSGVWNTDLPHCRLVDVLKFIQVAGGPRDIGGQGFLLADWDRDVYHSVIEFAMVTITVTNKNAPPNAAYWCGLTDRTILSGPFTPIIQNFVWTIFEDELTVFMCFDAGYSLIDTPNSSQFLGWGPFIDGKFYTWDFATGQLEGPFDEEPPPPPPPPEGLQLVAGWNNVAYTGPSQAIESAVASIMPYLVQISVYRQGVYHDYYPADPAGSTLSYLNNGEACWVEVTQDCFWSW